MVDVVRDPDRVQIHRLGDQNAQDVPEDRGERAVVEQRRAPPSAMPFLQRTYSEVM